MKRVVLDATGLLSKWGFWDGDILTECNAVNSDEDSHDALIWLVRNKLAPKMLSEHGYEPELCEIITCHNPIWDEKMERLWYSGGDDGYPFSCEVEITKADINEWRASAKSAA